MARSLCCQKLKQTRFHFLKYQLLHNSQALQLLRCFGLILSFCNYDSQRDPHFKLLLLIEEEVLVLDDFLIQRITFHTHSSSCCAFAISFTADLQQSLYPSYGVLTNLYEIPFELVQVHALPYTDSQYFFRLLLSIALTVSQTLFIGFSFHF